MRSEVFNDVYSRVVRLMGRDPSTASMTDAQSASIVDRINAAVREGWEYAMWPELVEVEERPFRTVYSATRHMWREMRSITVPVMRIMCAFRRLQEMIRLRKRLTGR